MRANPDRPASGTDPGARRSRRHRTPLRHALALTMLLAACAADPAREAVEPAGEGETARTGGAVGTSSVPVPPSPLAGAELSLCPINVANAPRTVGGRIARGSALACVDGVVIGVAPAPGACLSSGFGPRHGRLHKGVDYHSRPAVDVVAAAGGIVRVAGYREKDFGHWVVIDHGGGVYTGYAHLAAPAPGLDVGDTVAPGRTLGRMGRRGRASDAVHLHYEVRRGDFDTPRRWWGLEPLDPFGLPERCAAGS